MIEVVATITLFFLAIPVYVYVGYPLLLYFLSIILKGKRVDQTDFAPVVSLIVSCYNEKEVIGQKLENCLAIDYPEDKLEFIFVSDGSDDGTDDIIGPHCDERISLIRQEGRLGKTMGLNLAVPRARGEVIVFSDANAMYQQDAIRMIVRNFNNAKVGYVVGAALYRDEKVTTAGASENVYWQYEIFIKQIESKLHSVVGGDGAIYAIRKSLYKTMDQEDISDFVNPLHIIACGYRGVFDANAICFEQTAGDFNKEAKRKQRIVNRSFNGLLKNRELLNPFKYGFFSFEIISHKFLRWLVPFFIIIGGLGIIVLAWSEILFFQVGLLLGVMFIWSIMLGNLLKNRPGIPSVLLYPYYFYLVNVNSFNGVIQSLRGNVQITWDTPRQSDSSDKITRLMPTIFGVLLLLITALIFTVTLVSIL